MSADLAAMRAYARALASRTRLLTLDQLSSATELDVSELSRRVGVSQPLMSCICADCDAPGWYARVVRGAASSTPSTVPPWAPATRRSAS